ncbi:hypothetical protein MRB53_023406 [Persea americana]|uniref:Uncharacterized protein n=1 Tax=Persea americana TaxID=3435 RepID=A0ACC2L9V6_PERAE|nr:hypothetical protein MRB53_023406 [Persea americana]
MLMRQEGILPEILLYERSNIRRFCNWQSSVGIEPSKKFLPSRSNARFGRDDNQLGIKPKRNPRGADLLSGLLHQAPRCEGAAAVMTVKVVRRRSSGKTTNLIRRRVAAAQRFLQWRCNHLPCDLQRQGPGVFSCAEHKLDFLRHVL